MKLTKSKTRSKRAQFVPIIIDNLLANLTTRDEAIQEIQDLFSKPNQAGGIAGGRVAKPRTAETLAQMQDNARRNGRKGGRPRKHGLVDINGLKSSDGKMSIRSNRTPVDLIDGNRTLTLAPHSQVDLIQHEGRWKIVEDMPPIEED